MTCLLTAQANLQEINLFHIRQLAAAISTISCPPSFCMIQGLCELLLWYTVKAVLRDHCHETTFLLKTTHFEQKDLPFNITEPVTRDHLSSETTFLCPMGGLSRQVLLYCLCSVNGPGRHIHVPGVFLKTLKLVTTNTAQKPKTKTPTHVLITLVCKLS